MDRDSRAKRILLGAAIALVTALTYLGSLDGAFVADDGPGVVRNPLLQSLSWSNIELIFTSFDDANYMPLKVLSLAVDQAVWGPSPFGYHVTNLVLHIGCALVIFAILLRLRFSSTAACLVALLWAVHPIQVESVAWISERKNVLSGFFFFAAFRAYLEFSDRPKAASYLATLGLFGLALLSKMNTLVLPAVCLAYEAAYQMRYRWRDLAASVPLFALGALTAWYNLAGSPTHGQGFHGGSAIVTWLSSSVVVFRYLGNTLVPVSLTAGYDVPLRDTPLHPAVFLSLIGLVVIAALTVVMMRRKHRAAFWVLWSAITLAPMLNIIPFRALMNDRYMYLALLGPLAFAATFLDALTDRTARRIAGALGLVAVLACGFLTVRQVEHWSSAETLWNHNAMVMPMPAQDGGFIPGFVEQLAHFERAVEEDPTNPTLRNNLGVLYYQARRHPQALEQFEEAQRLKPDEPFNLMNLGRTYAALGRFDDAEQALDRAAELRPYNYLAWLYLLRFHLSREDAKAARRAFDECIAIRPELETTGLRREAEALARLEAE